MIVNLGTKQYSEHLNSSTATSVHFSHLWQLRRTGNTIHAKLGNPVLRHGL